MLQGGFYLNLAISSLSLFLNRSLQIVVIFVHFADRVIVFGQPISHLSTKCLLINLYANMHYPRNRKYMLSGQGVWDHY